MAPPAAKSPIFLPRRLSTSLGLSPRVLLHHVLHVDVDVVWALEQPAIRSSRRPEHHWCASCNRNRDWARVRDAEPRPKAVSNVQAKYPGEKRITGVDKGDCAVRGTHRGISTGQGHSSEGDALAGSKETSSRRDY